MKKKKPIGYTNEQTQSMKTLVERTQKDAGDYVGSGTVTQAPKKKKMKRMMDGGMAGMADKMGRKLSGQAMGPDRNLDGMKRTMPMPMPKTDGMKRTMPMPMPRPKVGRPGGPATIPDMRTPPRTPPVGMPMTSSQTGSVAGVSPTTSRMISGGSAPGEMMQRQVMRKGGAVKSKQMRGGGLARKGVGMALAKGGMVKANGCAKRGKTRGKMV